MLARMRVEVMMMDSDTFGIDFTFPRCADKSPVRCPEADVELRASGSLRLPAFKQVKKRSSFFHYHQHVCSLRLFSYTSIQLFPLQRHRKMPLNITHDFEKRVVYDSERVSQRFRFVVRFLHFSASQTSPLTFLMPNTHREG